jgi:hypothetical protein
MSRHPRPPDANVQKARLKAALGGDKQKAAWR